MGILLTKSTMPIVNWVAEVLGWLMNGIYSIGVHNLGLCIIIFTVIIYALMTPLQIKQQKFSKMNMVMQPEIQKIQKKYKNKKDQTSQMKMQEETMAVYEKYRQLSSAVDSDANLLCIVSGYYKDSGIYRRNQGSI